MALAGRNKVDNIFFTDRYKTLIREIGVSYLIALGNLTQKSTLSLEEKKALETDKQYLVDWTRREKEEPFNYLIRWRDMDKFYLFFFEQFTPQKVAQRMAAALRGGGKLPKYISKRGKKKRPIKQIFKRRSPRRKTPPRAKRAPLKQEDAALIYQLPPAELEDVFGIRAKVLQDTMSLLENNLDGTYAGINQILSICLPLPYTDSGPFPRNPSWPLPP